jgi:3-methylcrotonyl-CoA carboxylase alpha subunit
VLGVAAFAECQADTAPDNSPFAANDSFWLNLPASRAFTFTLGESATTVQTRQDRNGQTLTLAGNVHCMRLSSQSSTDGINSGAQVHDIVGTVGETRIAATVVRQGTRRIVFMHGERFEMERDEPLTRDYAHEGDGAHGGKIAAPMPGKILAVLAQANTKVAKGTPLIVMEAMKMEHTLGAPADGTVTAIHFQPGEQVAEGAELLGFEAQAA